MWHEARKQERRIRGLIVDYRRRAERRQDFYEKIVSWKFIDLISIWVIDCVLLGIAAGWSNSIYTDSWKKMQNSLGPGSGIGRRWSRNHASDIEFISLFILFLTYPDFPHFAQGVVLDLQYFWYCIIWRMFVNWLRNSYIKHWTPNNLFGVVVTASGYLIVLTLLNP